MNWGGLFNNTLSWPWWAALLAIPPLIVALYFLKLRRNPLEVPSTYLWSRTIEDLHVNSLWQRLRQSLLLLLQLLLIALAMLALLRPGWRGQELVGDRFIFLIDTSASMSAVDVEPSRLEEAKRRALDLVDAMKAGDVAMVLSFSDAAKVEQSFTSNRSALREAIREIRPTQRRSDLSEALRAAAGLANPGASGFEEGQDQFMAEALPADLYLFTDGGFAAVPDFFLGNLEAKYSPVGEMSPANLAVTAFTAARNAEQPDQVQVYARLENFGAEPVGTDVELYQNNVLLDAQRVAVPADGETGVEFQLTTLEAAALKLVANVNDVLSLDNVAYAAVNPPQKAQVLLITPGNDALTLALTTRQASRIADVEIQDPGILADPAAAPADLNEAQIKHETLAAGGLYDVIVYDQCRPRVMPQANTFFIGSLPPLETWQAEASQGAPQVIDVDRAHPVMQLVALENVRIAEGRALKPPPGAATLIDADIGPLAAIAPREGFEDLVLGFEIVGVNEAGERAANTDWPIRLSFPLFINNAIQYLGGVRGSAEAEVSRPGEIVQVRTEMPHEKIRVTDPTGETTELLREGPNTFVYSGAEQVGVYEVRPEDGDEVSQRFAINLFDSRESNLTPRDALELGATEVTGEASWQPARKELWKWVLAGALLVLMVEWYIYNRRVYL